VHARRAKALRATLSRRPRTIKKRDTRPKRRVSGLLFSLDRETEETPTHRCFSPGGANELSPGAEALEIMPNTRAPQVAIHRSFSPYHPGQPRTTRNLQIAGYPAYDPCLFQPISHPLAIQVSGHEFTRAVRMNKTPFPCAAGSRSLPFPSDIASARDTSVRARVHSCRQDERMPLPCAARPGGPDARFRVAGWRSGAQRSGAPRVGRWGGLDMT
jgi:hypothetical protein